MPGFCQHSTEEAGNERCCGLGDTTAALVDAQIHALSADMHYGGSYYYDEKEKREEKETKTAMMVLRM